MVDVLQVDELNCWQVCVIKVFMGKSCHWVAILQCPCAATLDKEDRGRI